MQYFNKIPILCVSFLLLAGILAGSSLAMEDATETTHSITPPLGQDPQLTLQQFEYQIDGRPDPFSPFISNKATAQQIGGDDIIEEDIELTGMRKFEPGQLTLVAVLFSSQRAMAMVEDVTGRGYVLTEGMAIGRRGVVSRIDGDQVTVIETAHTRAGRKLENTVVMRLNKEGDN